MPPAVSLFSPRTLLIYLLTMLLGGIYALVAPTLSFYLADHFQMRPLAVGGFFIAIALANIVYSQAIARWSDRLQQRHGLILTGMLLGGLACFAFAKAPSYWWVLLSGVTLFAMSNSVLPQIFAFSREYADHCLPPHRTTLFNSIVRACIALAWVAAPPLGFFLQSWIGFELQYQSVGVCYVITGMVAYTLLPRFPRKPPPLRITERPKGNTEILAAMGAFALLFGANHAYVLGLPMLLTQELGEPANFAGWLMGTAAALEIPVMLLAGWLAARLKLVTILRFGCAAAVVLYLGVWQVQHVWQMFALQILNAIFVGCIAGLGITFFQNMLPGRAGVASTLFTNTNQIGNICGSLLIAIFADLYGYKNLYGVNMLAALVAFGLLLWLGGRPRGNSHSSTAK
jgi:Arabinose efflux permease